MKNFTRSLMPGLLLAATFAGPAVAADEYGRSYSLHTLDYRIAETLVWDICKNNRGISAKCMVQSASPGGLTVFASQDVHAQIVALLTERDLRLPASLLFEIVLVRLVDDGQGGQDAPLAAHQKKALDAVREIFPDKRAEIIDTGLIRTVSEGHTRMGGGYEAAIALRSTISGREGLEFTVDLSIERRGPDGVSRVLVSTLSLAEGETVVAGSSRVEGEQAVVVLLTSKTRS